jgi:hypothetical protein
VAKRRPEDSVPTVHYRARPLAFEHGNLLPKGKDFEGRVALALAEDADHREYGQDEFGHETIMSGFRSSPEMKMWEIGGEQEKAAGLNNGAVQTEHETGQADMLDSRMEQLSRGRRYP